ncbi:beta-ketoacyl-ACP synthase 3 [Dactylosporangium fulvum]|uniref:Beta-ketoacyl-ACP synthase 3 n=1 Tax=Dactylosporangium fulvum TaxID=53359 RepID=A0ABY5WDD8_9ACTN|nr:beta-ketoacyl-ACP synthase 3 [Dactylosporangium fulvum]UWP87560.1 beta-ketoacyl-ACP synthase 3 [Dactylosporangium fulvum]
MRPGMYPALTRRRAGGARLLGVGAYRPERVVTNDEICAAIDSSDAWIRQRSGIVSRRHANPDETVVSMAVAAGREALAAADVPADRVDAVVVASMSNLQQSPPIGPEIACRVGAGAAAAFDLGAACAGFCHALAVADALVCAGTARHVLVIGSERMTDIIDPADRSTAFLFGDGAGAVLVGPHSRPGIGPVVWGSDGSRSNLIAHPESWLSVREKPDFWPTMRMMGQEVFRWAIQEMTPVARSAVDEAGLTVADLAAFVPHQANLRIVDKLAAALDLPPAVRVARDVVSSGNTSAASVPLALHTMLQEDDPPRGHALLTGFGAGLSYSALVVELP